MRRAANIIGERFHRLVVKEQFGKDNQNNATWTCECDCGNITNTPTTYRLKSGKTKSCGCLNIETRKAYAKKHLAGHNKLAGGEANRNAYFYRYKKDARLRGYEFDLSLGEFSELTVKNCHYCNTPPTKVIHYPGTNGDYLCNGIDRVNNKHGYLINNCVPCCMQCNFSKGSLTNIEFFSWIRSVYDNMDKNK